MPSRSSNRSAAAEQSSSALLAEAQPLLALATELRATASIAHAEQARAAVQRQLREFEIRAVARGIASARLVLAKMALAALIDDAASVMPWGAAVGPLAGAGAAAPATSPAALRPPGATAETPAQRLLAAARGGATDVALQELLRIIIAIGFDARALPGGAPGSAELAALRARLETPAAARPGAGAPLSTQWAPAVRPASAVLSWLPLWTAALAVSAALALGAFALLLALGRQSDQVYARLAALRPAALPAPAPGAAPRLAAPLAAALAAQQVAVRDEIDRSVVILPDAQLFEAGLADLRPGAIDLLRRVAAVLDAQPGRLRVIDHTDGRFERSARYPTEWDFSVERARIVHDALLRLGVDAARLQYDGRADVEPPAAGASAASVGPGRVEIELLAGR
jgi:type VI secretion system protein ImpK